MSDPVKLELVSIRKFYSQFSTPFNFRDNSKPSYSTLKPRSKVNIPAPLVQTGVTDCPPLNDFEFSEISVCYLPNVIVTHTGAVIFENKYLIEESLEGDFASNGLTEKDGSVFFDGTFEESDEVILNINKYGTFNYSIFIAEMLPMALVASFVPGAESLKTKIFFPEFMSEQAIQLRYQLLSLFGFGSERISRVNSKAAIRYKGIVLAKVNDRYRNHRNSQILRMVAAVVRGALATPSDTSHKRIYVSRQHAPSRQITEFESFQSNVIDRFDLHAVELDNLPLAEQVNIFSKVDVVLAEHGAGLINAIFMRPSSIVLEVFPKPMVGRWMYRIISHQFRLNYFFGSFDTPAAWRWNADKISVPNELYRSILSRVGSL